MKNVILFPGTDAVEDPILRASVMKFPSVKAKILETQEIIATNFDEDIDLLSYMLSPNEITIEGFRKLVFCSLATQVALYEDYVAKNGKPDCIMGLSLGDVPRSVVSGLVSYKEGVKSLYLFTGLSHLAKEGLTIHLRMEQSFEENKEMLQLEAYNISKSVIQNPKFGLIAGSTENINKWIKEIALPNALSIKPMYPFPLHCNLMKPLAEKLLPFVEGYCQIENLETEIFSTVFGKILTDKEEIIQDCTYNISAALDFPRAVDQVIAHYGKVNFISIGPSNSLLKFLKYMELPQSIKQHDYYLSRLNQAA